LWTKSISSSVLKFELKIQTSKIFFKSSKSHYWVMYYGKISMNFDIYGLWTEIISSSILKFELKIRISQKMLKTFQWITSIKLCILRNFCCVSKYGLWINVIWSFRQTSTRNWKWLSVVILPLVSSGRWICNGWLRLGLSLPLTYD
jgi:hypothetical protein